MSVDTTFSIVNLVPAAETISKATSACGLAIFGIEYILTFPAEVALYASRGRRLAKALFFLVRYLSLICLVLLFCTSWQYAARHGRTHCHATVRTAVTAEMLAMAVASHVFLVRTYAICDRSRLVAAFLTLVLLLQLGVAALVIYGFQPYYLANGRSIAPHLPAGPFCRTAIPRPWIVAIWSGISLFFDVSVLALVLTSLSRSRIGGGSTHFIEAIKAGQVGYILLTVSVYLTATVLFSIEHSVYASYFLPFIPAVICIAVQLLMLNDHDCPQSPHLPMAIAPLSPSLKKRLTPRSFHLDGSADDRVYPSAGFDMVSTSPALPQPYEAGGSALLHRRLTADSSKSASRWRARPWRRSRGSQSPLQPVSNLAALPRRDLPRAPFAFEDSNGGSPRSEPLVPPTLQIVNGLPTPQGSSLNEAPTPESARRPEDSPCGPHRASPHLLGAAGTDTDEWATAGEATDEDGDHGTHRGRRYTFSTAANGTHGHGGGSLSDAVATAVGVREWSRGVPLGADGEQGASGSSGTNLDKKLDLSSVSSQWAEGEGGDSSSATPSRRTSIGFRTAFENEYEGEQAGEDVQEGTVPWPLPGAASPTGAAHAAADAPHSMLPLYLRRPHSFHHYHDPQLQAQSQGHSSGALGRYEDEPEQQQQRPVSLDVAQRPRTLTMPAPASMAGSLHMQPALFHHAPHSPVWRNHFLTPAGSPGGGGDSTRASSGLLSPQMQMMLAHRYPSGASSSSALGGAQPQAQHGTAQHAHSRSASEQLYRYPLFAASSHSHTRAEHAASGTGGDAPRISLDSGRAARPQTHPHPHAHAHAHAHPHAHGWAYSQPPTPSYMHMHTHAHDPLDVDAAFYLQVQREARDREARGREREREHEHEREHSGASSRSQKRARTRSAGAGA